MIYFIVILTLLILISKIEFRVMNSGNKTDVYIKVLYIIKIHFNYKKFISLFNISKDKDLSKQVNNFITMYPMINVASKYIIIEEVEIIKIVNLTREFNIYSNVMFISFTKMLSEYLKSSFKKVKKKDMYITRDDYGKNEYDFNLLLGLRLFYIFVILFKGLKLYVRSKLNGSSNKYSAKG